MRIYTAHRKTEYLREEDADRAVLFVRDGFNWAAFLVPFLWLIWHRLWLALAIYLVAAIGLGVLAGFTGLPATLTTTLGLLINGWFGLEGNDLRRRGLDRRGFQEVADIAASDREEAAWRFFADRTKAQGAAPA